MLHHRSQTLVHHQTKKPVLELYDFDSLVAWREVQRLNMYSLIWIKEGKGTVMLDLSTSTYGKNELLSLTPYQPFAFAPPEEPVNGTVLHFHSDFFCIHQHQREIACNGVLFNDVYGLPKFELEEARLPQFSALFEAIRQDLSSNELGVSESILAYLKLILIQASRMRAAQESVPVTASDGPFVPQQLKDLIEVEFRTLRTPSDYAKRLHVSPKTLSRITKKYFNKTMTKMIADRVIVEAKRELYLTSKTVKEIALDLGYEDEFYFSRFFKKNTSISPSMFRETVGFARAEA